jgi:hypothetical protein
MMQLLSYFERVSSSTCSSRCWGVQQCGWHAYSLARLCSSCSNAAMVSSNLQQQCHKPVSMLHMLQH